MGRTKGMADPQALNKVLSSSFGYNSYEEMMAADKPTPKKGSKKRDQMNKKTCLFETWGFHG